MSQSPQLDLEQTLDAFADHIQFGVSKSDAVSDSTSEKYTSEVRWFAAFINEERDSTESLLDVSSSDLRQYFMQCRKNGDKPKTIVGRRAAISRFYNVLPKLAEDNVINVSRDNIPANPEDDIDDSWSVDRSHKSEEQGGRSYLRPEEVSKLYRNVPAPAKRNRLILKLLYQTGVRRGECATIRLDDISPIDNQKLIIRATNSKSGERRMVYYKESLIPVLREWIEGGYRDSEGEAENSPYLFPTRESEHIHPGHITRIVKQSANNAGLQAHVYTDSGGKVRDKVTAHTLRHSFAVNLLKPPASVDVRTLQGLLGHSDLEVTEQYLDIVREDERREYLASGGPPEGKTERE